MKCDLILNASRWRWLLWFVGAMVMCALMSRSVSPLFPFDAYDSAVYRMVGECWLRGALPYVDVFDNKGPYFYLIQAAGAWLGGGRWGIFLMLVVNYTVILELLWRITALILSKISLRLCVLAVFMLHFLIMAEHGNVTEDWGMVPTLLSLWIAMRKLAAPAALRVGREVYVYGLCFGVVALMRPSNTMVHAGIVLGFSGLLLYRKQFKALGIAALRFTAGAAAAIAPMAAYFYCHNALDQAFYCIFTYNIHYSQLWVSVSREIILLKNALLMLPTVFIAVGALLYDHKYRSRYSAVIVPAAILFVIIYFRQATYYHYYALLSPLIGVAIAMVLRLRKPLLTIACAALLLPTCYINRAAVTSLWKIQHPTAQYIDGSYNGMSHLADLIPPQERHDVMSFDIRVGDCAIYPQMHATPPMRFTYLTTQVMTVDSALRREVDTYLRSRHPRWILTSARSNYPLLQQKLHHYTLVAEDRDLRLYRRR